MVLRVFDVVRLNDWKERSIEGFGIAILDQRSQPLFPFPFSFASSLFPHRFIRKTYHSNRIDKPSPVVSSLC